MLQPSKLTLDSGTATVEVAPSLRLAGDQRVEAGCIAPDGLGLAVAGRAAPLGLLALEVGPGERPRSMLTGRRAMLPALHGDGFLHGDDRHRASSLAGVVDEVGVVALRGFLKPLTRSGQRQAGVGSGKPSSAP